MLLFPLPKTFVVLPFTFTCNTFRVVFHIQSPLQFSSVAQPCPTLCNPMDCSTPGFLVPHQLPEAVHVNQVGDAIQPPHPPSSPDVQAGFRKGRGTRHQIVNIHWIIKKARQFQKNNFFCFIDYAKAFDCVDHKINWKILKEMGLSDHLTCFLRNLYAGQEAATRHGIMDWFQIGKRLCQGCMFSPCLFNIYAEYIM